MAEIHIILHPHKPEMDPSLEGALSALEDGKSIISTPCIEIACFDYWLDRGYRLFVHEFDGVPPYEVELGVSFFGDKYIRREHNIPKLILVRYSSKRKTNK